MFATKIRVIDFETTGMPPGGKVIEAAYCDVHLVPGHSSAWLAGDVFSSLYGADEVPPEVRAVHHIQPEEVSGLLPFLPRQFVADAVAAGVDALAAHQADFEDAWIKEERGIMPILCTYKTALRLWPDAPSHSNQALRYWLQDQGTITVDHTKTLPCHRAGPDTYVTAELLRAELKKVTSDQIITWTKEPRLLPFIPIGRYRGEKWSAVDEGFLTWMLKQPDMEPDLKWNARRELDRRATL